MIDYNLKGQDSFVYKDKYKLHELYEDYELSMNDSTINTEAFDYICQENKEVGLALSNLYDISDSDKEILKEIKTVEELCEDSSILDILINTDRSMNLLFNNNTVLSIMANSQKFMNNIINYDKAINIFETDSNIYSYLNNSSLIQTVSKISLQNGSIYTGKCYLLSIYQSYYNNSSHSLAVKNKLTDGSNFTTNMSVTYNTFLKVGMFFNNPIFYSNFTNTIGQAKFIKCS